MAFTSSQPPSLASVPPLTLVHARGVNGALLASWKCVGGCAMDVASMAFVAKLSATLDVPRRSIHLIWGRVERAPNCGMEPDASSTSACTNRVTIDVVVRRMKCTEEIWGDTADECCCCGDPCIDIDDHDERQREENCYRCTPCMLCDSCSVEIPQKGQLCLQCVGDTWNENAAFLNRDQLRRYYLAKPAWKAERVFLLESTILLNRNRN